MVLERDGTSDILNCDYGKVEIASKGPVVILFISVGTLSLLDDKFFLLHLNSLLHNPPSAAELETFFGAYSEVENSSVLQGGHLTQALSCVMCRNLNYLFDSNDQSEEL
eukprot:snap_masked-scaffold_8-processed-gene-5.21-mRNA-1 protein AED:1.00 eAED:1.00 QI:0/0/0/0/1/1/2/0/108